MKLSILFWKTDFFV